MALQLFTLDTNCVSDVEERRPNASHIRTSIQQSRSGSIELAIPAIGASKKQRNEGYANNFIKFQEKLTNACFGRIALLPANCIRLLLNGARRANARCGYAVYLGSFTYQY